MKHNWIYITVIVALVAATLYLWETPPQSLLPLGDDTGPPQAFPYATVEGAHTKHFNHRGELNYEFVAQTLKHYRSDGQSTGGADFTTLEQPEMTLYAENEHKWFVSAEHGEITELGDKLILWDGVRIRRPEGAGQKLELNTERLIYLPDENRITTDEPVQINGPHGQMHGVGMNVELDTQTIQLLSRVRGRYEPI